MPRQSPMSSAMPREITNRRRRISPSNPNSRIGFALHLLRWRARANFVRAAPPRLTSDRYSDAFDQVKSLGIAGSTTATADEALTGRFWNGAIQNYWNEIAQTASVAHNLTTAQNARLFALLNLSFADGLIAFYDAKYTYNFWRPVTAIR